jgi:hypothetical protein
VTLIASASTVRPSSTASNVHPANIYGANPTLSDVRSLLGDDNWWPGPPSFGVRPLDSATMPFNEKFHVITRFVHLGTAETLEIEYTLWDSTQMTNIQSSLGTSVTGAKLGDQALYYGSQNSSAAPFATDAERRLAQPSFSALRRSLAACVSPGTTPTGLPGLRAARPEAPSQTAHGRG